MARNDQNRKFSLWCFGCSGVLFLIVGIGVVGAVFLAPLMHAGRSPPLWIAVTPYLALVAGVLLLVGLVLRLTDPKLLWLVVAHVVAGVAGSLATWVAGGDDTLQAIFSGLVFCEVSLLGLWAGSAAKSWPDRLVGVAAGSGYLCVLVCIRSQVSSRTVLDVWVCLTVCTLVTAAVLLIARCFRVQLSLPTSPVSATPRLQSSLRDLMILTLVVACVVGFGRRLPFHGFSLLELGIKALSYLPFVVIGLVSVWPALSARHPLLPCSLFVAIAVAVYAVGIDLYLGRLGAPLNTNPRVATAATQALTLIASLLVVRSCGYRLVRLPAAGSHTQGTALPGATA